MSTPTLDTAPARQLRLTRRGRLVVFLAALALIVAAAVAFGASSMATDEPGVAQETEVVMVGEGETLWDIASARAEGGDVRELMHAIEELNALDSAMLMVGQELHVPVRD